MESFITSGPDVTHAMELLTCSFAGLWWPYNSYFDRDNRFGSWLTDIFDRVLNELIPGLSC